MHIRSYLAAAGALSLLAPAYAAQQKPQQPIVVTAAPPTVDQWTARTGRSLERHLRYPMYLAGVEPNEGVVRVTFWSSESGTPSAVTLASSSGHGELDRAALHAVKHIHTLQPLPAGVGNDQRFQALILFAKDDMSYARQMAAMRDEAKQRNAWASRGGASGAAVGVTLVSGN